MKTQIAVVAVLLCASAHAVTNEEALALCEPIAETSMMLLLDAAEKRTCAPAYFERMRATVLKGRDVSPSWVKFVIDESKRVCVIYAKKPTQDKATFEKVVDAATVIAGRCGKDADFLALIVVDESDRAKIKRLKAP